MTATRVEETPYLVSSVDLAKRAGITYRQLDHWTRLGYLTADEATPGSGSRRHYAMAEVSAAIVMADLVYAGVLPAYAAELARELLEHGSADIAGMPIHLPEEF